MTIDLVDDFDGTDVHSQVRPWCDMLLVCVISNILNSYCDSVVYIDSLSTIGGL